MEGSNLRPTGSEPAALIFGLLGVTPKYDLHQPVPKAPAQQQPVENRQRANSERSHPSARTGVSSLSVQVIGRPAGCLGWGELRGPVSLSGKRGVEVSVESGASRPLAQPDSDVTRGAGNRSSKTWNATNPSSSSSSSRVRSCWSVAGLAMNLRPRRPCRRCKSRGIATSPLTMHSGSPRASTRRHPRTRSRWGKPGFPCLRRDGLAQSPARP